LLKRIISDIETKRFLGILLLFGILVMYAIYFPETVEPDDTKLIKVILADKPNYDEDAETGYDFFTLSAKGIGRKFLIKHWVLNERTKKAINKIQKGYELVIIIGKTELNGKYIRKASNSINVLGIKELNKDWVYSLTEYNQGKTNRWKEYLFYGLFFGSLLFLILIGKLRRIIKNEPEIKIAIETNEDYG
jgi:hypothetical protein